jgi:hypothetical protein
MCVSPPFSRHSIYLIGAHGPKIEVISHAIEILLADGQFWTDVGEYKTLALHPSHRAFPHRSCILKATGLVFLLHYIFIGAPIPVSPFLFSTMFDGREATCRYDLEFLSRFIPSSSLDIISQIHSSPLKDPLYMSQGPLCVKFQYLLNIVGAWIYLFFDECSHMVANSSFIFPPLPGRARWTLCLFDQLSHTPHN